MLSQIISELQLKDTRRDEEYAYDQGRLRLKAQKLKSGKYQVRFDALHPDQKKVYGYLLLPANFTLKVVVEKILLRLKTLWEEHAFSTGLFHVQLGDNPQDSSPFLVYESK